MVTAWILVFVGLLVGLPALLAAKGVLRPNVFVGLRTASTRSSPEAWQKGNASGAQVAVPAGFLAVLLGLFAVLDTPAGTAEIAANHGLTAAVILTASIIVSTKMADRAAQSERLRSQ